VGSGDEERIAWETRSDDASGSTSSPPYLSTGYDEKVSSIRSAELPIYVSEIVARTPYRCAVGVRAETWVSWGIIPSWVQTS
jgi:hypothetical protein